MATPGVVAPAATAATNVSGIPPTANIVQGYDIEALVSAAMGTAPMPTAPTYLDAFGMPLTRMVATPIAAAAVASAPMPAPQQPAHGGGQPPSALDIANAALAALGGGAPAAATRILVLSNMVLMEDLASDADYQGLQEEVREECAKYGQLRGMQIPRSAGGTVQQSAVLKIFLEYASVQDAQAADRELKGRQFGDNVVQVCFNPCPYDFVYDFCFRSPIDVALIYTDKFLSRSRLQCWKTELRLTHTVFFVSSIRCKLKE